MSKKIIEILLENFPQQKFEHYEENYGGTINAFFIKSSNESILKETWEKIRNMIGVYFQSKLESEFDVWNIYLFYIVPSISKELKHLIEHDTVSSRKIIVDDDEVTKAGKNDLKSFLFSEHITNVNLSLDLIPTEEIHKFSKSTTLSLILDKIDLVKAKKNKEEILGTALDQIEKSLLDEI